MKTTPIRSFGKDHWALLAYCFLRCVDSIKHGEGKLVMKHLRCNEKTHSVFRAGACDSGQPYWRDEYSTKLASYFDDLRQSQSLEEKDQAGHIILGHDDWDCLDDFAAHDLIEIQSHIFGLIKMTEKGMWLATQVLAEKARGKSFAQVLINLDSTSYQHFIDGKYYQVGYAG